VGAKEDSTVLKLPDIKDVKPKKKPQLLHAYSTKYYHTRVKHLDEALRESSHKESASNGTEKKADVILRKDALEAGWRAQDDATREEIKKYVATFAEIENKRVEEEKAKIMQRQAVRTPADYQR
jgi:hypothetical protein